ncbi:hypothetical protein Tco_0590527 [Tanacetum coccineum]
MFEEFRERQQAANIDQSPPREMSLQEMEDLKQHYLDEMLRHREGKDMRCKVSILNAYPNPLDGREMKYDTIKSTRKVSILEGFTNEPPLEENDDLFDLESKKNEWKKILYDDPIDDLIFDPRGDIDEIDAFLDIDIPTNIKDDFYDSEGDVLYFESLLSDDTTPSPPPEVFLDRDPRSLRDINDLKIMVKIFDPGIHETIFSPTYVSLPFEYRHYLTFTYVIRIFLPYFTYPVNSSLPLSSGSEDIIFDPDIFVFSLKPVAYEFPMEVCSSTCFIPNITMIWGESS